MSNAWQQWEGQIVNGVFRLDKYLGGGEGRGVFLTEVAQPEPQKAAIKLVSTDAENAELQLSRWNLAAKLSHPHLMRLLGMGRCQLADMELLYVLMEYAEESLLQVIAERPITLAEAREILDPALDALAYVHSHGFVHGHLKPTNIMAVNDQLRISSDGLSRVGEASGAKSTLTVYDPPEFSKGEILPAGDVWSLGVTIVEALTQQLPVWERTGPDEPVVPPTLPAPFLDLARHCLLRDPQRRYTVADVSAALRPPSVPDETGTPQKVFAKRRYLVPAIAFGLLLAAILLGPRLLQRGPSAQPAPAAVEQPGLPSRSEPNPVTPEVSPPPSRTAAKPPQSEPEAQTATGPGAPGDVLHQVLPDVPRSARATIRGKVKVTVRVRVAPSGNVAEAKLDSTGPSQYFAQLALKAARRWKFVPAKADGQEISGVWLLRFEFGRAGTKVLPVRRAP